MAPRWIRVRLRWLRAAAVLDGVLFTVVRVFLAIVACPVSFVHRTLKRPFRSSASRTNAFTRENVFIELWVFLWLILNWKLILPLLSGPSDLALLLALSAFPAFRLGDLLYFLLRNHIPRKRAQLSVGRSLLLLVLNYLEVWIIFACFYVVSARLAGCMRWPTPSEAKTMSFRAILTGDLEGHGGVLPVIELGLGYFILAVVLVQILSHVEKKPKDCLG